MDKKTQKNYGTNANHKLIIIYITNNIFHFQIDRIWKYTRREKGFLFVKVIIEVIEYLLGSDNQR